MVTQRVRSDTHIQSTTRLLVVGVAIVGLTVACGDSSVARPVGARAIPGSTAVSTSEVTTSTVTSSTSIETSCAGSIAMSPGVDQSKFVTFGAPMLSYDVSIEIVNQFKSVLAEVEATHPECQGQLGQFSVDSELCASANGSTTIFQLCAEKDIVSMSITRQGLPPRASVSASDIDLAIELLSLTATTRRLDAQQLSDLSNWPNDMAAVQCGRFVRNLGFALERRITTQARAHVFACK